jgi:CheY-like chemotaxis protein/two-component sensor histidine kinase
MASGSQLELIEGTAPPAREELARLEGQFLASLNHEIRTPLSGIMGMMELLLETSLDEQQREYVATTRVCAESLLGILNDTLEYSALSAETVALDETEFNVVETLKSIAAEHRATARDKGLELKCLLEDSVPETAVGDPVRVGRMLSCLIGNAVKFTHHGTITMTATAGRGKGGRDELSVIICDTGIGIPAEKLAAIFNPFRQLESGLARNYAGLGLGLAIARKTAVLLGGDIRVESQAGNGSTFTVTIPLGTPAEPEAAAPAAPAERRQEAPGKRPRILVAEDDRISQRVICHHLRRNNYEPCPVGSGEEALQAASEGHYDAILMDLQLPGIDGFAATDAIRQLPGYGEVPVLALTANYGEEFRNLCLQHGMQAYLPKPVKAENLLASVAQYLPRR